MPSDQKEAYNDADPTGLAFADALVASLTAIHTGLDGDLTAASGPVIDIVLSVILLDQSVHDPTTLVGALNPPANDANGGAFQDSFPYLNPPFEP